MVDLALLLAVIAVAVLYDFYNGMNDCANAIATTVATRAMSPLQAVALASFFNFAGAFISTKVAATIGKGVVDPSQVDLILVFSGVFGAAVWTAICSHLGIPISVTHSLIGGLLGAGLVGPGWESINFAVITKVVLAMVLSPIAGFIGGLVLLVVLLNLFRRMPMHRGARLFRGGQIASASLMALTHGMNDAQNAMGVITLALLTYGALSEFAVPAWVIILCASAMAAGTFLGGWRVIRTMGQRVTTLQPSQGFAAEASAAAVIGGMSQLGMPISTTHVIASSIMGTGVVKRLSDVRWRVVKRIVITWIVTIPGAALIAGLTQLVFQAMK